MSRSFNVIRAVDRLTVFFYLLLVLFGWLNVYGASVAEDQTSIFDLHYRSGMQFIWIVISMVVAIFILFTDSRLFPAIAYVLYGAMIFLLILTVFIAPDIKGSRSWLPLGPFSIQPAEFSKFITALALAKVMSNPQFRLNSLKNYSIVIGIIIIPMLIIIAQKETGSALVYASFIIMLYREGLPGMVPFLGICAIALFVIVIRYSGIFLLGVENASLGLFVSLVLVYVMSVIFLRIYQKNKLNILILSISPILILLLGCLIDWLFVEVNLVYLMLAIIAVAVIYLLVLAFRKWRKTYWIAALLLFLAVGYCCSAGYIFQHVLRQHQRLRIEVLLGMKDDPSGIGYNTEQARIAIGSGGFMGKGFLQGTQTKLKYVPEQDTDFIFCTVGEEWGFIGSVGVILVYLAFLYRLLVIAERQERKFTRIYGYCVVGIFAFHLFINIGMVLGIVPVIGIPLPFFSYGGSSFLSFTILLTILLKLDTVRIERVIQY